MLTTQPFKSKINTSSERFKANKAAMMEVLKRYRLKLQESLHQGSDYHIKKAVENDKFLARQRIELLLDESSPFLEIGALANLSAKGLGIGGTTVTGIGVVSNKLCIINANIGTKKGGSIDQTTLQKSLRIAEIAMENNLPVINLVESGGANLPEQAKIFNYGGINFRETTRRSEKRLTTISIVFGNSTAGGAYIPAMSDYTVFVKNKAKVFLAGPPLVKMATNEIVDDESLGGADMHSKVSGVSDYMANDELEAIKKAREIMEIIKEPQKQSEPIANLVKEPVYDKEEILGVISPNLKQPIDCKEIIARLVDESKFHEFKPNYGNSLITGWCEIHGYKVGVIGNNGVIFSEAANKGAHFIQLCNQNDIPLLFLQNTTGFMVGKKYEEEGIIKHGAKLINAVSNSKVPSITIMIGASYGAGNYAMNGRAYQPRFLFSWPQSKIAVMGPEQLAGVMEIIQRQQAKSKGIEIDEDAAQKMREQLIERVEEQSNAYFSSGQLWDDGVIDPRDTRTVLGICLAVIHNSEFKGADSYGIFRM